MTNTKSLGEVLYDLEKQIGQDTLKDLIYLQKVKSDMANHPEAELIEYYTQCRKDEIVKKGGLDSFLDSTSESEVRREEESYNKERQAGHNERALEIIDDLIERTKKDGYRNPRTNVVKRFIDPEKACEIRETVSRQRNLPVEM